MSNELTIKHHGILGQKWGVRRFQNPDGSLTDEGRKRYGYGEKRIGGVKNNSGNNRSRSTNRDNRSNKWDRRKTVVDSSKNAVTSTSNIIKDVSKIKARRTLDKTIDFSSMSDHELKEYVNRKNLEKQYANFKAEELNSGKEKVLEILDIVGNVLVIGASAIAIISYFDNKKNKSSSNN